MSEFGPPQSSDPATAEAIERDERWLEALELEWRKRRYADRADEEDAARRAQRAFELRRASHKAAQELKDTRWERGA